jgi:DNA-directed RNA polymerase subunit alpha
MTIATNGSISPQDALAYAAKILIEHLSCFTNLNANIGSSKVFSDVQTSTTAPAISINLSDLNLSVRSFNALNRQGIHTLQELSMYSNASLESIRSLGKKSLVEIRRLLKSKGIALKS